VEDRRRDRHQQMDSAQHIDLGRKLLVSDRLADADHRVDQLVVFDDQVIGLGRVFHDGADVVDALLGDSGRIFLVQFGEADRFFPDRHARLHIELEFGALVFRRKLRVRHIRMHPVYADRVELVIPVERHDHALDLPGFEN